EAAAIWSATQAPVSLFAEELEPRALFEWYRDTRARLGISVLPLDHGGIRKVLQALREQEIVITAIDRDVTGTGYLMPFFGKLAPIPLGPAAIALRLGTPLLPVCLHRKPDDTFGVEIAPLVVARASGNVRADQVRVTQELLRYIEDFIRRHPADWHVPHRIWSGST
ncbi:MAG TPA: lysophospholipid acyltransferase family protein, partial [Solirubrobacteraceae bacterium]